MTGEPAHRTGSGTGSGTGCGSAAASGARAPNGFGSHPTQPSQPHGIDFRMRSRATPTRQPSAQRSAASGGLLDSNEAARGRFAILQTAQNDLLRFTLRRLQGVALWQNAERDATIKGASLPYRQAVLAGAQKPDPARWGLVAAAWETAALALCAGDLGLAAARIDEALELEEQARAATSAAVSTSTLPIAVDAPASLDNLRPGDAVDAIPRPPALDAVTAMTSVQTEAPDVAAKTRGRDPWWTIEQETDDPAGP